MSNKISKLFSFYGANDIGQRANQEDYFSFCEEKNGALLLVLADGMGGHSAGEIASRVAVESFIKSFSELSTSSLSGKLSISLERANGEIKREAFDNPSRVGMGCTLVAAYIAEHGLSWASVGDSMLMLVRRGAIRRLNADHSMVPIIEASLKEGKITSQEAANHPQRNALRSALTGDHLSLVDISNSSFPLQAGDCLICASDGLATLSDIEIRSLATKNFASGPEEIARSMLKAVKVKNLPRQDNTTIQVVCIHENIGAVLKQKSNKWIYGLGLGFILVIGVTSWKFFLENSETLWFKEKNSERLQSSFPVPVVAPPQTSPAAPEQRPTESRPRIAGEAEKERSFPKAGNEVRPPTGATKDSLDNDKRVEQPRRSAEKNNKSETRVDTYKPEKPTPPTPPTLMPKDGRSHSDLPGEQVIAKDIKPASTPAPITDRSVRDSRSDEAVKPKTQNSAPQAEASP